MSGKVPSRVRIARTQRNTPKYAGNMNKEGLISCGFGRNKVMCQKIKSRTAAAAATAAAAWVPEFVDKDLNDLVATTTAVDEDINPSNFYGTLINSNASEWLEISLPQTYYISSATATFTRPGAGSTSSYIYFYLDGTGTGQLHNNVAPNATETSTKPFQPPIAVNRLRLYSWWNGIILDSLKLTGSTIAP